MAATQKKQAHTFFFFFYTTDFRSMLIKTLPTLRAPPLSLVQPVSRDLH